MYHRWLRDRPDLPTRTPAAFGGDTWHLVAGLGMRVCIQRFAHWALFFAALAGCAQGQDVANGSRGELGHVEFNYQRSCFFGCSLAQPLLAGTRERIGLSDSGDAEG